MTYPLLSEMEWLADAVVLRLQVDEETVVQLLRHPAEDVGLMVADALAHLSNGNISPALLPLWEDAIVNYKFKDRTTNDYHVSTALKQHPATIVKWLKAKINEEPTEYLDGFSREAIDLMPELVQEQRVEIVRSLPDTERAELVASELVGTDIDIFKEILANQNTRRYQLGALARVGGDRWVQFAELALETGWDEDEIASQSSALSESWSGPASAHWKQRMARFDEGLKSNNPRILTIARKCVETYQSLHDYAVANEKKEDIFGFN